MRALLVVNPKATATTPAGRDLIASLLADMLDLRIVHTEYRGHAAALAEEAAGDGVDLVLVHGGDGTVNEVVNGLLAHYPVEVAPTRPPTAAPTAPPTTPRTTASTPTAPAPVTVAAAAPPQAPALAVVPGGSANVFARALGIPREPMAAIRHVLAALRAGRCRRIGLGRIGGSGRWFTFNAGLGFDADVVAEVEQQRRRNPGASPWLYARTALTNYARAISPLRVTDRPPLEITLPGGRPQNGYHLAFVSNTDPWTYLGPRPVRLNPGCSFDSGLGVFALRDLAPTTIARHIAQALGERGQTRGGNLLRRDNVESVRVMSAHPVRLQVDGDYLGRRREVTFTSVPDALRVIT